MGYSGDLPGQRKKEEKIEERTQKRRGNENGGKQIETKDSGAPIARTKDDKGARIVENAAARYQVEALPTTDSTG